MLHLSKFPTGTLYTPVPNPLFGPLLEEIEDLAELKVTLRGLWSLHQKPSIPQMAHRDEFLNDTVLRRGLNVRNSSPLREIERGLELAIERGTFLQFQPDRSDKNNLFYLLNTDANRRAIPKLRRDGIPQSEDELEKSSDFPDGPTEVKPNIFVLYEDNIGTIGPVLAEELKEAEGRYPRAWINEAFKISIHQNKRSWAYISAILRRWAAEGKNHGEFGRHSEENSREKYLEEYERRWGQPPRD